MQTYRPRRPDNPPGLREQEKRALARFEKKARITDFESGQLQAYVRFGDQADSDRAAKVLRRYEKQRKKERRKEETE